MPPSEPKLTNVAEQNARFHCPRMLFAWYVMTVGIFAFAEAVVRNTPKYRVPLPLVQPIKARPVMVRQAWNMKIGALIRYLSPIQPVM